MPERWLLILERLRLWLALDQQRSLQAREALAGTREGKGSGQPTQWPGFKLPAGW
jgi:hypothetical protein